MSKLDEIRVMVFEKINDGNYITNANREIVHITIETKDYYCYVRTEINKDYKNLSALIYTGISYAGVFLYDEKTNTTIAKFRFYYTKKLEYKIEELKELTHQIMSSVRLVLSTKSNLNQIDNIKIEI